MDLSSRLARMSLQWRILALATAVVAVVSVGGLVAVVQDRTEAWRQQFQENTRGMALALQPLLRNSLVVGDLATVQETLDAIARQGFLQRVALLKPGERSVILEAIGEKHARAPAWFAWLSHGRHLESETPIVVGGVDYGILVLEASESRFASQLRDSVATFVAVGGLSLLGIVILLGVVLKKGLAPLEILVRHAGHLGAGSWQERIPPIPVPEIAQVADAFNHMADKVVQRESDLVRARDSAEAAARAKATFLAAMSHEIRTPMNGILGMTELALSGALPAELRSHLEVVRSSGEMLMTVLNDILDYSKIDAGRLGLERRTFDVHRAVTDTADLFSARCREKGLELAVRMEPEVPAHVMGDPVRLRQVLSNLLSNAVKFTDRGGVTLEVALFPREGEARRLAFRVADTGIGIPAGKLEDIFDPFVQAEDFTTRRYGGTGLGLAISRRIVQLMGGNLLVHSEPGRGSTFHFAIPLEAAAKGDEAEAAAPSAHGAVLGRGQRILVAEDAPPNQILVRELLKKQGFEPVLVADGQAAVSAWRASIAEGHPFHAILMDVQMPLVSGLEATRRIRQEEAGTATYVPIVALTANAFESDRAECLAAGMDAFLSKPFGAQKLYALLEALEPAQSSTSRKSVGPV